MTQQLQAILELHDWSLMTGQPLPYPAEVIVRMEQLGQVVDLVDGPISWDDNRIATTATGLALVQKGEQ